MSNSHKLILAVLASQINSLPMPEQGIYLRNMSGPDIKQAIDASGGVWLGPRSILENNVLFRQFIPYVILRKGDQVIRYKRTKKGGEGRLHDKFSIGFGGHVEVEDLKMLYGEVQVMSTLAYAADREVSEELHNVPDVLSKTWDGLLIDKSNEVGQVHLGVVQVWEVASLPGDRNGDDVVDLPDESIAQVEAVGIQALFEEMDVLEPWSQMIVQQWASPNWPPV